MDLFRSKWAPEPAKSSQEDGRRARKIVSRVDEMQKSQRLLRRVQWKSSLLRISHQQALANTLPPFNLSRTEARAMFKIDFFEFYVLLERMLVYLLGVFRIPVSRASADDTQSSVQLDGSIANNSDRAPHNPAGMRRNIIGSTYGFKLYHRFHAEVLDAFNEPTNPLHQVLGVEPVKTILQNAKDYRNKWKDAADSELLALPNLSRDREVLSPTSPNAATLEDLQIDYMLDHLLAALFEAQTIAQKHVEESAGSDDGPFSIPENVRFPGWIAVDTMDIDEEEFPWEAIPDGMDWQYG